MMRGFVVAKSVFVAARLGVADLVNERPMSSDEIALRTSTDADALYRLLRALSSVDIFTETEPGRFALGRLGPELLSSGRTGLRNWILVNGGPIFRSFDGMLTSVRTGQPVFPEILGMSFFDYFENHPDEQAEFNAAMDDVTRQTAAAVLRVYDFATVHHIVDVGGGGGALLAAILRAYPEMSGTLFDRQAVVDIAHESGTFSGLGTRSRFVGGDFFSSVPGGADLYLLSWILHDWDDQRACSILRSCRRAIPANGRLLLVEAILPGSDERHFAHFADIVMLVALGGRERTEREFGELLAAADFRISRVIPTNCPRSIIEAVPV